MEYNKFSFRISDAAVNASFKTYLLQNTRKNVKMLVGAWLLATLFFVLNSGSEIDIFICLYLGNVCLALLAWFVTTRYLWTIDCFSLLFSLSLIGSLTIVTFCRDKFQDIEGDNLVLRNNIILIFN
jgi:hypothetical protein